MNEDLKILTDEINQIISGVNLGSPEELINLPEYQERKNTIIAEFDKKIAEIQSQIDSLNVEITTVEAQVSYWRGQRDSWLTKSDSAKAILDAYNKLTKELYVSSPEMPTERWPVVRAGSEVFMYDHHTRLRWFPDGYTFEKYGYKYTEIEIKDISWFYDKPIQESIRSELTGAITDQTYIPHYEDYKPLLIVPGSILANYKSAWGTDAIDEHSGGRYVWGPLKTQVTSAESGYNFADGEYDSTQISLEAKTRHMRDLTLAKEAAEEEKRGALSLWDSEYQAAEDRKRIELDSIARDISLGYPSIDAETAKNLAQMSYEEALKRGFTRLQDAMDLAKQLAEKWEEEKIFPHLTTQVITCSKCGARIEITTSDIEEQNRDLTCPYCGQPIGRGIAVRVIEVPPPVAEVPLVGEIPWYKKYWKYLAIGGAGVTLTGVAVAIKKKRR